MPPLLVAPWLAWAVIRTFGLEGGTRLVPLMTFTPYMGLTAVVPLLVALALRRWVVAALALVVCALFAAALLPRAVAGPQPDVAGGVTVRVMTSNLYIGRGDARTVVGLVARRRVDVLAVEELPPEAVARLDAAGLRRLLPYRNVDARGGAQGTGLFSRHPLTKLPSQNRLDHLAEPRALIRVPGTAPIDVHTVHPPPPINGQQSDWETILGELPRAIGGNRLHLLIGDFNATLDHRVLRDLLGGDGGYVDAADATGKGYDTTWPAGRRFPPEITIDHVLIDPRMRAVDVSVHLVPRSDHRAVIATLAVPRG